jgi:hypothetical protein
VGNVRHRGGPANSPVIVGRFCENARERRLRQTPYKMRRVLLWWRPPAAGATPGERRDRKARSQAIWGHLVLNSVLLDEFGAACDFRKYEGGIYGCANGCAGADHRR